MAKPKKFTYGTDSQKKYPPLKTVKIYYEDGTTSKTNVSANATQESVNDYFVGKRFNRGSFPKEKMVRAVKVKLY